MEHEENNNSQDVEEIKDRLKIEIEIDEEEQPAKSDASQQTMADELSNLGRQFAETLRSGWKGEERAQFEQELREGVNQFVHEVDKLVRDLRGTGAQRLRSQADTLRDPEAGDIGRRARTGVVQGLRWLSDELGRLADQFSPQHDEQSYDADDDQDFDIKIDDDNSTMI